MTGAEVVASWVVLGVKGYLAVGSVFAVIFALNLAGRIDPAARRDGWFVVPESAAVVWVHVESRVVRAGNRHADAMAGIEDQAG